MPTNRTDTNVLCPFYRYDSGQKLRITCEGLVERSCLALIYQKKQDYRIQMETFCCGYYDRCEVYQMLMQKYEESEI